MKHKRARGEFIVFFFSLNRPKKGGPISRLSEFLDFLELGGLEW